MTEIVVLDQFYQLLNSDCRYILFRGSTRSGKTIAIIQYILSMMMQHNIDIVVGVETLKNAKKTVIKDLEEWIFKFNIIDKININRSEYLYTYKDKDIKSSISIVPCDSDTKWFGLKADIFWFNEATHIDKNVFEQAEMRLPDRDDFNCKLILDFNPTSPFSWVRDLENTQPPGGLEVFVSTYKDNPFLGDNQVKTIESWQETNYNKWLVFGQGEYGDVRGAIYSNWSIVDKMPNVDKTWYGLDFGYTNDVSSLVKVCIQNGEIYLDELIYENGLTNQDLATKFKELGLTNTDEIIADSSEPKSIEEIKRSGFRVTAAKKGPNSILNGIDILQRYKINITRRSKNIQDEIINYTWVEDRTRGEFTNKAVDDWNHALDAVRYIAILKLQIKPSGSGIIMRTI